MSELETLAERLGRELLARGEVLAIAESCTGGWVAQSVTAIAGSSAWFDRGFVTYSNEAKTEMLNVPASLLETHGAVAETTARAMAEGALANSRADWALAVTGVAGPSGGTAAKPVGMVCFAWARRDGPCEALTCQFAGSRAEIREQAVRLALSGALKRAMAATLSA
jgi:nicotinamide-nucleotide amidase